ncbi:MAG: hypothetical protein DMF62_03450 [Acidobacteria bacterium]|nr:MAG: hypothetical protein DMF62_03450 [Acidobacteriota bacterium]
MFGRVNNSSYWAYGRKDHKLSLIFEKIFSYNVFDSIFKELGVQQCTTDATPKSKKLSRSD